MLIVLPGRPINEMSGGKSPTLLLNRREVVYLRVFMINHMDTEDFQIFATHPMIRKAQSEKRDRFELYGCVAKIWKSSVDLEILSKPSNKPDTWHVIFVRRLKWRIE